MCSSDLNRMRALVVDDNQAAREILSDMLAGAGLRVVAVATGAEAIAAVKDADATDAFRVVFIDWQMPGMDGIEVAQRIRELETPGGKPHLVMVTAFGREEVRAKASQVGLEMFLVKPVSQSTLVDVLVTLFAPAPGEIQAAVTAGNAGEVSLPGVRVLLAEDNEINQQIAIELLESAGASIDVANNGREAVDRLAAKGPSAYDVVLMDLQMPEMDGYEAVAAIRAQSQFDALPVIAMTAHAMAEERDKCLAAGMNDHITKPIDPQTLFRTVRRWVKVTAAAAATTARPAPEIGRAHV